MQIELLLLALVIMMIVYFMNKMGEKRMICYLIPAIVVWGLFYYSGVHSTISVWPWRCLSRWSPVTARSITCTRWIG